MATILRSPLLLSPSNLSIKPIETQKRLSISIRPRGLKSSKTKLCHLPQKPLHFPTFIPFAAYEETTETDEVEETETQESSSDAADVDENGANDGGIADTEEKPTSVIMTLLESYIEAIANNDKLTVAEIEAGLLSIEDEKKSLENKVAALSQEMSSERERILRISADFDNFRKRTERERLSLVTNVQGEVVENLLPVLDNFERAKAQIKVETEGEEKINNSYQSIYKQFVEILTSLGVDTVETVGNPFDPLLHEAIMREESAEFEEGIIIQEFRKGFKLGERLLRPSMVKVSAGPGPAKLEGAGPPDALQDSGETSKESNGEEQG
ncbi:Protein GrpE [Cinnamomum micranthum f. kanehirae]|uniref:GrpE protein homolog n=1 Tax=Cinnamomum micranthum f. kanehirae TaxID=337451 RepID=A0A3S3MU31_9MAGN|nr:Protein GrpE [Cinnamomum micranthum f. kanehirae]